MRLLLASIWLSVYSCEACNPPTGGGGGGASADGPMADNLASGPGDYAWDYLRKEEFTSLLVEVDYVAGRRPSEAALDALQDALETHLDKPDGVGIVVDDEIPSQGAPTWTYEAAEALEVRYRDHYRDFDRGEAVLYFLYLDGHSDSDDADGRILGYAYHGSSLVMFKDTISDSSGPPIVRNAVEPTVIVHELGHVLGLVRNGIPMQLDHLDTSHGAHCDNPRCLMYWAVQRDKVSDLIHQGPVTFDADCLADLAAARR